MPTFVIREHEPIPARNTSLILPGRTHLFSITFAENFPNKTIAVYCSPDDGKADIFAFDTPEVLLGETEDENEERMIAKCIGANLLRKLTHNDIYPVEFAVANEPFMPGLTAKHFCDMSPNSGISVNSI